MKVKIEGDVLCECVFASVKYVLIALNGEPCTEGVARHLPP